MILHVSVRVSKRIVTYSQQWRYWQWWFWWFARNLPSDVGWTDEYQLTKRSEEIRCNRINSFRSRCETNHVFTHAEQDCIGKWPDGQEEQGKSRRGQSPLFASHSTTDQFCWTSWVDSLSLSHPKRREEKRQVPDVATNPISSRVPLSPTNSIGRANR